MIEECGSRMAEALEICLKLGMKLPFTVAVVGVNGSVIAVRYTEGPCSLDCDVLAEHFKDSQFQMPVNMMVVDAAGEAARLVLQNNSVTLN